MCTIETSYNFGKEWICGRMIMSKKMMIISHLWSCKYYVTSWDQSLFGHANNCSGGFVTQHQKMLSERAGTLTIPRV